MGQKAGAAFFFMMVALTTLDVASGGPARAQNRGEAEANTPSQDQVERAKALFRRGKAFFAKGRYAQAADAFEGAYRLHRHKAIEYNLAVTHAMLGHDKLAVAYLRAFLRHERNPPPLPEVLRKAQARVGVVVVSVISRKGVQGRIYVNGRFAGKGHAEKVVDAGRVVLEVRVEDRVVAHKELMVTPGRETVYEFAPVVMPRQTDKTPRGPGRAKQRHAAGGGISGDITPKRRGWSFQKLHWAYFVTAGALTVGLAAGAVATGVMAKKTYDEYQVDPTDAALRDRGKKLVTTTNAMWGAAAGMAVTAVILGVFTKWKSPSARGQEAHSVTVAPVIVQGGGGLVISIRQ